MFTKKIHRHEKLSTISPPITGPEDRAEQRRHADHAHHPPHPLRPRGLGQDRLPDRQDHAAAEPLDDPEEDQRPVLHASPHNVEPTRNSATDTIHTRRPPNRSIDQPVNGITVASASR